MPTTSDTNAAETFRYKDCPSITSPNHGTPSLVVNKKHLKLDSRYRLAHPFLRIQTQVGMSRHRIVHNLDLDDELADYDGGEDYEDDAGEELGEEEAEHLKNCTATVREALKDEIPNIGDKEIQDSLWHYYYDVDKSVKWLRGQQNSASEKTTKKKLSQQQSKLSGTASKDPNGALMPIHFEDGPFSSCVAPFSAGTFFKDCPWLNVPSHRRGEILVEPLYPYSGLLGGSSTGSGTGKVSKLAALAAARKKKNNADTPGAGSSKDVVEEPKSNPVALLEKLGGSRKPKWSNASPVQKDIPGIKESQGQEIPPVSSRQYRAQDPSNEDLPSLLRENDPSNEDAPKRLDQASPTRMKAQPSSFARAIFGTEMRRPGLEHKFQCSEELDFNETYALDVSRSDAFTEPSPDDAVINAQNKKGAKGGKPSTKKANPEKGAEQAANGVGSISIEESSRVKSKNLDVLSEYEKSKQRNSANFVVIGHVDHGKSTLMGRLLYDIKVVDSRTIDKFRKEAESIGKSSFALAWVLDQTSEERSRGVTMDIATNQFETEKTTFTILDAPGHRDFIPNMIAGASQADFAVLVIDGSPNAFESGLKGQTKEHALLVRSMGVQQIIVAVNKMDLVCGLFVKEEMSSFADDFQFHWSEERFREIEQQMLAFLTAAGFQSKNISFVPCSGLSGENVVLKASDKASWYSGPTLVEKLDYSEPMARALDKPMRITIGDIFRGGVMNPLSVSGRLDAGSLQVGDGVIAMPSGESAYIKGIELDQEPRDWTVAGQIATLHLTDIDPIHLKTGDILCSPESPIKNISSVMVKILAFDHITPMAVDVHRGRLHAAGQIVQLVATLDKSSGHISKKKPRIIQPGTVARIRVDMDHPVPLEAPTRIVLRAGGETVAAGLIE
ncbi:MAG: Hsp70 suppressor, GTPase facilitates ribosomal subunit dissociation [Sclerophora amabilis]|nr:MAG: Hsp70 suppressor, GTPase facilitates ribosomal subunit dissociation [Sclerophora amabilis]